MIERLRQWALKLPIRVFAGYLGTEVALGFIGRVLERADPRQVLRLIEEGVYDVFSLAPRNSRLARAIERAKPIIKEHEDVVRRSVTPENIMAILRDTRPDILSLIINHPRGREWLRRAVETSLERLLS